MSTPDKNRSPQQAATGEQVPHSGVHHGERPVEEFDNTPLSDAPIRRELPDDVTTEHLPPYMRLDDRGEGEKKSGKKGLVIGGSALAAVALGGVLYAGLGRGSAPNNTAPRSKTGTSAPATPTPEASPAATPSPTAAEGIALPPELQPENLMNLTPAQIEKVFQIRADQVKTPEEFAIASTQRVEAGYRAGCTKAEWQPFANSGKGAFSNAMVQKYFEAYTKGMFGYVGDPANKIIFMDRCNTMMTVKENYVLNVDIVPGTLESTPQTNGAFTVSWTMHYSDNYELIKKVIGDRTGTDSTNFTAKLVFTNVRPNPDGLLYAEKIDVYNNPN